MKNVKEKIDAYLAEIPSWDVIFRAHRIWRNKKFVSKIDHDDVIQHVIEDGRMTSRYSFMVLMACAIAILGLLLSSPAVIIGAMLISPLMGPIMSLGFSLCVLDYKQMKKALEAIVIGFFLSITISLLIVTVSPLSDPTPEIMARTHPNLFDLLVAIFSGLAGGYATIKQKGATIVGVAIATALMPPLAVVGYGIATGAWNIVQGSFFLFMTNLLAISLSVTALAKWYGFGSHNSPKYALWQTGMIFGIFVFLSIPLGLSLLNIAQQTYVTKTAKAEIRKHFETANSRISNFSITFNKDGDIGVDCLVVTDAYSPEAENDLKGVLEQSIGKPVNLSLDQIVVAKEDQEKIEEAEESLPDSALTNPMQAKLSLLTAQEEMAQAIKNAVFFPLKFVKVDPENDTVSIYPKAAKGVNLTVQHSIEEKLRSRFPGWSVFVVPPVQVLPFVYFEIGQDIPTELEKEKVSDIIWALRRWDISEVNVVGFASSVGEFERFNNTSLAYRRARSVADLIEGEGFKVKIRSEYTSFDQRREERNFGINSLHRVEVRFARQADLPELEVQILDEQKPENEEAEKATDAVDQPAINADTDVQPDIEQVEQSDPLPVDSTPDEAETETESEDTSKQSE